MKPLILVTNDDSIHSKGISELVKAVKNLGEVIIVAPDSPQSGKGHAISVDETLHLKKSHLFPHLEAYECSGTPADCVKIAKHYLLKDRKIDLVVSGINHGHNGSISVVYSGTMSAAIEAAIEEIPSIGFSMNDFGQNIEFGHASKYIKSICKNVLTKGVPKGITLNVNFPKISEEKIKGIKVCRQTRGIWQEEFEPRKDPYGRTYFWMGGFFVNQEPETEDTDMWAIENNYVSVVPVQFDLTAYSVMKEIKKIF